MISPTDGSEPTQQHKEEPAALVRQLVLKIDGSDLVAKLPEPKYSPISVLRFTSCLRRLLAIREGLLVLIVANVIHVVPVGRLCVSAYFREGQS